MKSWEERATELIAELATALQQRYEDFCLEQGHEPGRVEPLVARARAFLEDER